MYDERLDELLGYLRRETLPKAPDLRRGVRAEIARIRDRPGFWRRILPILNWNELLMQPRLAAGALAVAVTIGIMPGAWTLATARPDNKVEFARKSLHLEVFDAVDIFSLPTSRSNAPGP